jgi:hypothetical protein
MAIQRIKYGLLHLVRQLQALQQQVHLLVFKENLLVVILLHNDYWLRNGFKNVLNLLMKEVVILILKEEPQLNALDQVRYDEDSERHPGI